MSLLAALAGPLAGLAAAIAAGEFPDTTSVIVVRHGAIAYERYFGKGAPDLLNDTRSATKSVTSLAVGLAIADHRIASVDAPAFAFLADLRPFAHDTAQKEQITVADLLTMSSALDCDDNRDASPGNEDRMHEQPVWVRWAVDLPTRPYARDAAGRGPFAYCTAGAFLMGQVVQRAEGEPVDRFITRRLFAPLGIRRWEWPRSPAGEVMTGGGLRLASRDLAKLAWLMEAKGAWRGRQVVPAAWMEAAMAPRRKPDAAHDYGYFFWRTDFRTPCGSFSGWYMAGNGGNWIVALPGLDAAAVITRTHYNQHGMHDQTQALMERFVVPAVACGKG
jgi:CubicO group peptidase (beta-lactamase class C family)